MCEPCRAGKFWHRRSDSTTSCEFCAAGQFQDQFGTTECKLCPPDTYRAQTFDQTTGHPIRAASKKDCLSCPPSPVTNALDRTTGLRSEGHSGIESCKCKTGVYPKGYYSKPLSEPSNTSIKGTNSFHDTCTPCPENADCSAHIGVSITGVVAQPGFWKYFESSVEFASCAIPLAGGVTSFDALKKAAERCCPGTHCKFWLNNATADTNVTHNVSIVENVTDVNKTAFHANWGPDVQCRYPYKGILCTQCADDHVKMGEDCVRCEGGDSKPMTWGVMVGGCSLLTLFQTIFIVFTGQNADKLLEKGKKSRGAITRAEFLASESAEKVKSAAIFGQMKMFMMCESFGCALHTLYNNHKISLSQFLYDSSTHRWSNRGVTTKHFFRHSLACHL